MSRIQLHLPRGALLLPTILFVIFPVPEVSEIRPGETKVTNHFPDGLTFTLEAESDFEITHAEFIRYHGSTASREIDSIEIENANDFLITYHWDTSRFTVAPSSKILFNWELEDSQGNKLSTPQEEFDYDDVRFDWNERRDDELIVRWYEGDQEFGARIFQIARLSLTKMEAQSDQKLDFPVIVLLYANESDFQSWHFYVEDWVGGQSFTAQGITTQILPSWTSPEWILDVIPHEIAHLFFYQIIESSWANWPPWLDEGLAQYYALVPHNTDLEMARQAARSGNLIPLLDLDVDIGLGRSSDEVYLAYAESISVVTYIIESYDEDSIERLIDAFREGIQTRDAIHQALGVAWEEFEAGWISWMGVPVTPEPSPIPTQPLVPPTYLPPSYFTPTAMESSEVPPTSTVTETPSFQGSPNGSGDEIDSKGGSHPPVCGGIISLILIPVVIFLQFKHSL